MRAFLVIALCLFTSSAAFAADEAKAAAKIFERACLNKLALSLTSGSSIQDGIAAAETADKQMTRFSNLANRNHLVGRPRYKFPEDESSGRYFCHVSSKTLSAEQIVEHFHSLSKTLSRVFGKPEMGRAAIDGDPSAKAEGLRSTFSSVGLTVEFEAIRFHSTKGPVAGYVVSINHDT